MAPAFILEGVLLFIVGLIGFGGNIAAIIVFSRKRRIQRNFHALMLSLSIFDMIYIIVSLLIFSLPQFFESYITSGTYFYILPWALPFAQIGLTGSIYFTMAITVERYFTVCHPFFHLSHGWPAKRYVIPIFFFAVLYNIPKFFELQTKVPGANYNGTDFNSSVIDQNYTTDRNETLEDDENNGFGIIPTDLRNNHYYFMIYCMWLNFILMGVGPFVVLITLNSLMLMKLKEMARESEREHGTQNTSGSTRQRNLSLAPNQNSLLIPPAQHGIGPRHSSAAFVIGGGSRQKEVILAKVSLAIVFVFIVCHSIKWIPNIYELLQVGSSKLNWPEWVETITNFSHLLTTFNSSVNFFIYFAKHYKTILKRRHRSDDTSRMLTATTRLGDSTLVGTNSIRPPGVAFGASNNGTRISRLEEDGETSILLTNSKPANQPPDLVLVNGILSTQV